MKGVSAQRGSVEQPAKLPCSHIITFYKDRTLRRLLWSPCPCKETSLKTLMATTSGLQPAPTCSSQTLTNVCVSPWVTAGEEAGPSKNSRPKGVYGVVGSEHKSPASGRLLPSSLSLAGRPRQGDPGPPLMACFIFRTQLQHGGLGGGHCTLLPSFSPHRVILLMV